MQPNQQLRVAILLGAITLAITGAAVSTTTGVLVNEEELGGIEIEAADEVGSESNATDDENVTEKSGDTTMETDATDDEPETNESDPDIDSGADDSSREE